MWFLDEWYFILVLPAILISIIASVRIKTTFKKYNSIKVVSNVSSNEVINKILMNNEIYDVNLGYTQKELGDHYDPRNNTIVLSSATNEKNTIGAIGVAAHEAGHAIQYSKKYFPVILRTVMVPAVNIGSYLGLILIMIGMLYNSNSSVLMLQIGIALYSLAFIFTLVTLPVEIDASRRAIAAIDQTGVMSKEELGGVKKVLTAAALTYVASMLVALANLLRIIILVSGRGRRK